MPPERPNGQTFLIRGVITLLILQTTILLAGIPWALGIHGSVSTIKTKVEFLSPLSAQYIAVLERLKECEVKIEALNAQRNTGDPFDAVPNR